MKKLGKRGYVLVILTVFVPLLLLSTRYVLDTMTNQEAQLSTQQIGALKKVQRKCAKQASLAIAKNWNPAMCLKQQKQAVLKIADRVYNDTIPYDDNMLITKAVPGVQMLTLSGAEKGSAYDPLKLKMHAADWTFDVIEYKTAKKYLNCRKMYDGTTFPSNVIWNLPFMSWKLVDNLTDKIVDSYDKFDEIDVEESKNGNYVLNHFDRFAYPHQWFVRNVSGYPTRRAFTKGEANTYDFVCNLTSSNTSDTDESGCTLEFAKEFLDTDSFTFGIDPSTESGTYTYRSNPDDSRIQVSVENDSICVKTGDDIAYAKPAECNVDIVLACPVNSAATNIDNRDANTPTLGVPYTSSARVETINDDIKKCPIYQIGQGFRAFAKNFYHTRGVTMGLIPYSGKISLDPAIAEGYTQTYKDGGGNGNFFDLIYYSQSGSGDSAGQNEYPAYLRPAGSYESYGMTDKDLNSNFTDSNENNKAYDWNTTLTACPIRCRAGKITDTIDGGKLKYANGRNRIFIGDILSKAAPTSMETRFFRQNSNPCYGGYANLLSFRCETNCTVFLPNPYYIIEPTADMQKIYEQCGALYPFYDQYNVSNFIFAAVSWANNLWQAWTRNPECTAKNTDDDSNGDSAEFGRLSCPSKRAEGRKKALILVVNKPDWFEPGELTYLGFDNDFSEIPMIESDCIRGDIDYSDTTKKFADGTSYDGTICGAKKILTLSDSSGKITKNSSSGFLECDEGTVTLKFPKKYLVKVVVEPVMKWTNHGQKLGNTGDWKTWGNICWDGEQYIVNSKDGLIKASTDGITWTDKTSFLYRSDPGMCYGDGKWLVIQYADDPKVQISIDSCNSWASHNSGVKLVTAAYGNGIFLATGLDSDTYVYTSTNGINWGKSGSFSAASGSPHSLGYVNGKWMMISREGSVVIASYDNGANWSVINSDNNSPFSVCNSKEWNGLLYSHNKYWTISEQTGIVASSQDAVHWTKENSDLTSLFGGISGWRGFGSNGDTFITKASGGYVATATYEGSIQFPNIISQTGGVTNAEYKIKERKEFFIEPNQINEGSDENYSITMKMKNIKLISAEITNRPYVKVQPTVSATSGGFVCNSRTPFCFFAKPNGSDAKITFKTASGVETFQAITSSQFVKVSPEAHQYIKTYDANGIPSYSIAIAATNCTISSPAVGVVEEHTAKVENLNIKTGNIKSGTFSGDDGKSFSYSSSTQSNKSGTATISGNKIICPIGSVLHVKATPATLIGSITFYGDNGVEDNVGTYTFSGTKTFKFSGGKDPSGEYCTSVTSSRGVNFGHNLSKYKVRYSVNNAKITSATLSNQYLRDYCGQYGREQSGYKQLILNDGTLGKKGDATNKYIYSLYSTFNVGQLSSNTKLSTIKNARSNLMKFSDSCVKLGDADWHIVNQQITGTEYRVTTVGSNGIADLYWNIYGVSGKYLIISLGETGRYHRGNSSTCKTCTISLNVGTGYWISSDTTVSEDEDPFRSIACATGGTQYMLQMYVKNGVSKSLLNTTIDTTGAYNENIEKNEGIALQRLSSKISDKIVAGDYICFQGDGDLTVDVDAFYTKDNVPTITFNCPGEDKTIHELYKTGNFCIESSQMTDNGDGKNQYVTFSTTGNVSSVTATYHVMTSTQISVAKPNNIELATYTITGHKNEIEWNQATKHPIDANSSMWNSQNEKNRCIEFDGLNYYTTGKTGIYISSDHGSNWTAYSYSSVLSNGHYNFIYGADGLWFIADGDGFIYYSSDLGSSWNTCANLSNLGYSYCWAGFTYANKKFVHVSCYGWIITSDDGFTWIVKGRAKNLVSEYAGSSNDGWNYGCTFVNGTWITWSDDGSNSSGQKFPKIIKSEDEGETWTKTYAQNEAPLNSYTGKHMSIAYGSNILMILGKNGQGIATVKDTNFEKITNHGTVLTSFLNDTFLSLGYGDGVFLACSKNGKVAIGRFHDGVMWDSAGKYVVSRDIDDNVSKEISSHESSVSVLTSHMTITRISARYYKVKSTTDYAFEFKKLRLPEMSRVVDYSANKNSRPLYDENLISYGENETGKIADRSITWNSQLNCWTTHSILNGYEEKHGVSGWHHYYKKGITGDFYLLINDIGSAPAKFMLFNKYNASNSDGAHLYNNVCFNITGLTRQFLSTTNQEATNSYIRFDICNINDGAKFEFISAGITLPLNTILYFGVGESGVGQYKWQYDQDSKSYAVGPTQAVSNVTKDACAKLKSDWKDNLRIYIVKYRKQEKYKHPVTGSETAFDYKYLDECATSSDHLYDVSDEDGLKSALQKIADDIKSSGFADYKPAKNVSASGN